MNLTMDEDVQRVCEFMQTSMAASKLVAVAGSVAQLAPVLWGRYQGEDVTALALEAISPQFTHASPSPPVAIGSAHGALPCACASLGQEACSPA